MSNFPILLLYGSCLYYSYYRAAVIRHVSKCDRRNQLSENKEEEYNIENND